MNSSQTYLFIGHRFSKKYAPQLCLLPKDTEQFYYFEPLGKTLTIEFDTQQRYCTGWHDLATKESFPCPDASTLPAKYQECRHCQQKTGFNPAFYHADSVSPQQAARNAQPHTLYLAYFGPKVIKVGITLAERGLGRLLDQGARSALLVKTFPSAEIARQYEAAIAALPGFAEMVQTRLKQKMFKHPYDEKLAEATLQNAVNLACQTTGITPQSKGFFHLDHCYLDNNTITPHALHDSDGKFISGKCIGMVGSTLFCEQQRLQFKMPLSKLAGYKVVVSPQERQNSTAPQQISLF